MSFRLDVCHRVFVILDGDTADEEAHVQMSGEDGDGSGVMKDILKMYL